MKEFKLSWEYTQPIFFNKTYQKVITEKGEELELKKIKDIENFQKNSPDNPYNSLWENLGTLVVHCKNDNLQYKCDYFESGEDKRDLQMFTDGDFFFESVKN